MKGQRDILLLICLLLGSCAPTNSVYMPPGQQAFAEEFHTITIKTSPAEVEQKIDRAMKEFTWLNKHSATNYSGVMKNPTLYVDCGSIASPSSAYAIDYAAPSSVYESARGGEYVTTSLAANVKLEIEPQPDACLVRATIQYTLVREHLDTGYLKIRRHEKNTPINFDTLTHGSGPDGVTCKTRFTLEQAILKAITKS